MAVTYTTLTVGRSGGAAFTVGRSTTTPLTVRGYSGAIVGLGIDLAFLTESGDFLALESSDLLLTA